MRCDGAEYVTLTFPLFLGMATASQVFVVQSLSGSHGVLKCGRLVAEGEKQRAVYNRRKSHRMTQRQTTNRWVTFGGGFGLQLVE